jgi:hypothetical protein
MAAAAAINLIAAAFAVAPPWLQQTVSGPVRKRICKRDAAKRVETAETG